MTAPDLWTVIDRFPSLLPFTAEKLANALGIMLVKENENEYFTFYKAGGVALADGVFIHALDLRIRKEQPHPGFLVLSLSGTCVPKTEVFARYPQMVMTDHPRGRSLDEEASYTKDTAWGKLSFGFAERAPDCLRTVVFTPN